MIHQLSYEGLWKAPAALGEATERSIFQRCMERAAPHSSLLNKQWGWLIKAMAASSAPLA